MRHSTLHAIAATIVCGTVMVLATALVLPRFLFWALERYAEREGGLQ